MKELNMKAIQIIKLLCFNQIPQNILEYKAIFTKEKTLKFSVERQEIINQRNQIYCLHVLQNILSYSNVQIFADLYLKVAQKYLKRQIHYEQNLCKINPQKINKYFIYIMQSNINRILFSENDQIQDLQALNKDYSLHKKVFQLYMKFYCKFQQQFQFQQRVQCVKISKFLKVCNPQFIQYIKQTIQTQNQNYSTADFLLIFTYLIQSRNTPYEYFYKNKKSWLDMIQSSHDFSNKKNKSCVRFLQLFSKQRFVNCQQIYSKLIKNIQCNLDSMDGKQLVRILYFYSKSNYGMNINFLIGIVEKIYKWIQYLELKHILLLIRSLGNLNYQNSYLLQRLKGINYQQFLGELKNRHKQIGPYEIQIEKEIQRQADFQKQQIFVQVKEFK